MSCHRFCQLVFSTRNKKKIKFLLVRKNFSVPVCSSKLSSHFYGSGYMEERCRGWEDRKPNEQVKVKGNTGDEVLYSETVTVEER